MPYNRLPEVQIVIDGTDRGGSAPCIRHTRRRLSKETKMASMPRKEDLTVVLNLIGVGSFGRVRLVRHETTGAFYALKCMNKGLVVARKQVQHVSNEKNILAKCSHPFLVNLVGWYQDRHDDCIVLFELLLGERALFDHVKGEQQRTAQRSTSLVLAIPSRPPSPRLATLSTGHLHRGDLPVLFG